MKTIAQRIVDALISGGFDTLYCLPGVQNDELFDVLYDYQDQLRPVHARHEQGAMYMAMGAAMATGRPQACSIVPGPGFLNASAALATAWAVNAPVLTLVGEISSAGHQKELGELHEIPDQMAILMQLTKWAARVDNAAVGAGQIAEALQRLASGRPRPVGLEIPTDIYSANSPDSPPAMLDETPKMGPGAIARAAGMIAVAQSPLIVVGSGAQDHSALITALAEAISAPIMANRNGRGVLPADHALSLLPPVARALWPEVDLVIGLGTRLGARQAEWGTDSGLKSIHIDIDAAELARGHPADLAVHADLGMALPELLDAIEPMRRNAWCTRVSDIRQTLEHEMHAALAPQKAWLDAIRNFLPDDGILVTDLTQVGFAAEAIYPVMSPRTLLTPGFQGTLGWAIATGIGAANARRDVPVVAIAGDGGALFTLTELATARHHAIPAQIIVFNDGHFGNVRRLQMNKYGNRPIASDLTNPDFVALAKSFGIMGQRAETPTALTKALEKGYQSTEPGLIEVPVGEFSSVWPYIVPRRLRG